MRAALAGAVLALAGSATALPHHHKHEHGEWGALEPHLERRPTSGAKRTNFGTKPCTRLAETGCDLIPNRPTNVGCHQYYEVYPVTGQDVICRAATFGGGCRNYVYGEGMFNYAHVRRLPFRAPPAARAEQPRTHCGGRCSRSAPTCTTRRSRQRRRRRATTGLGGTWP